MKEQSVVIYTDYLQHLTKLPYEECGMLFLAILTYAKSGVRLDGMSPAADMAFSFISARIDRDKEKYELACEKRRENGKKGGRPRKEDIEEVKEETKTEEVKEEKAKEENKYENAQISIILPPKKEQEQKEETAEKSEDVPQGEGGIRPEKADVALFFKQRNFKSSPKDFYEYYEAMNWCTADGTPMKTWQSAAFMWEKREQKYKPTEQKPVKAVKRYDESEPSYDIEQYKRQSMQRLIDRYGNQ